MMPHIIFLLLIASSPFLALGDETASWGTLSSGPSESECRPYIEKALQGASIHDSPSQTGDTDDVGGTETQEPISQSEVSESESSENPSEGVEEEHQPENSEVNENESSETVEATTAEEKSNEAASGDDGDEETSTENTTGILSDEPTKSEEQIEVAVEGTSDEEETDVRSEPSEENEQNSEQHVGAENTDSTEEQTREEGSQEDKVSTEEADTSGDVVDEPGEEASDQRDPSREDIEESKEDNQDTPSQESPEGEESKEVPTEEGSQETPTEEGSQETPAEERSQEAPDEEGSQEPPAEEGSQEAPAEEGSQETQPEEGRQETQPEGGSQEALAEEESQETPAEEGSQEVPIENQGEEPQSQEENHEGEEVVESQEEKSDEGASAAEGDDGSGEEASSILNGTGEPASGSAEESETPDEISQETEKSSETADKSEEATDKSTEEGETHSEETKVESEEANKDEEPSASEGAIESEEVDQVAETTATSEESETTIPGDSSETLPQESEEQKDSKLETESASQEAVVDSDEATKGEDSKETEKSNESEGSGEPSEVTEDEQEKEEPSPEEELSVAIEIPEKLRSREHMAEILRLNAENEEVEKLLGKTMESTLRELKKLYDNAIKPLEILYKYRDLSNRHFGDPEIFSKPLILFMGPWSGGKSTIVNYLLENEYKSTALRTGAEPSPAYFNIVMWGDREEVLDGTQLAADWTFSGLQKFGQGLLDRLRGLRLNHPLLEKVNIVEIPGILEIRKQVERLFPFNDACQWFIDRADIIFLVYDPSKLDVGPETEAILDQLKGREMQTRIILNKADQVKPEELMRVQGTLIWNISPLMSSTEPPVMYSTSLWSIPYESGAPARLLYAQERAFLKDLRDAIDKRVENKIASARRFAVRVRNHAKMVDCYLTTYYNHKSFFGNKKKISDDIIEHPQNYHIYEGLSTLTNISRYDLPDPDVYRDFFRLNPVYEFQQLSSTCTYFRGCPINRLDVAIAYDLPELVGKYKKNVEEVLSSVKKDS